MHIYYYTHVMHEETEFRAHLLYQYLSMQIRQNAQNQGRIIHSNAQPSLLSVLSIELGKTYIICGK